MRALLRTVPEIESRGALETQLANPQPSLGRLGSARARPALILDRPSRSHSRGVWPSEAQVPQPRARDHRRPRLRGSRVSRKPPGPHAEQRCLPWRQRAVHRLSRGPSVRSDTSLAAHWEVRLPNRCNGSLRRSVHSASKRGDPSRNSVGGGIPDSLVRQVAFGRQLALPPERAGLPRHRALLERRRNAGRGLVGQ